MVDWSCLPPEDDRYSIPESQTKQVEKWKSREVEECHSVTYVESTHLSTFQLFYSSNPTTGSESKIAPGAAGPPEPVISL
jgi:hypothetical protein